MLVPAATLDESLPPRTYAYAKLDVEGAERLALAGATRLLAAHNPPVWQVEAFDSRLARFGSSAADLIALLRSAGYVMATYDADQNSLTRTDAIPDSRNILAIAEGRWDEVVARLE